MKVRHDRGVPVQRHDRVTWSPVDLPAKRPGPGGSWDVAGVFARSGIQEYEGEDGPVREARPPSEVRRSAEAMRGLVVTLQHPGDGPDPDQGAQEVTPENARALWHGHVLEAAADWPEAGLVGGWVRAASAEMHDAWSQGTQETSVGYTAVLLDPRDPAAAELVAELGPEPGVTHDGERYDLIQTQITPNHLAVVDRARAGAVARLRVDKQDDTMKRKIQINGKTHEVATFLADSIKAAAVDREKARADQLEVGELTIEGQTLTLPKATIDQILAMLGAVEPPGPSMEEPMAEPPMDASDNPMPPPRMDEGDEDKKMDRAEIAQVVDAAVKAALAAQLPQTQARLADAVTRTARDRADLDRRAAVVLGDAFDFNAVDEHGVAVAVLDALKSKHADSARALAERARKGDAEARGSLRTHMDLALDEHRDSQDSTGDLVGAIFHVAHEGARDDSDPKPSRLQALRRAKQDSAARKTA